MKNITKQWAVRSKGLAAGTKKNVGLFGRALRAGFTLLEVMIVITVLAAITAMASQAINGSITKAQTRAQDALKQQVAAAKSRYLLDNADSPSVQTTFDSAAETARFTSIAPYLAQRGVTPASVTNLVAGTGMTNLTIGNSTTAPTMP